MKLNPIDYDDLAKELILEKESKKSMIPPFFAECVTPDEANKWNNWMVRNHTNCVLDMLLPQPFAERLAEALNKVYHDQSNPILCWPVSGEDDERT